jgi:hypothetical protein
LFLALQAKALAKACLVKSIELQITAFIPEKQTLPDNFIRLINAGVHEEMLSGIPIPRRRASGSKPVLCQRGLRKYAVFLPITLMVQHIKFMFN